VGPAGFQAWVTFFGLAMLALAILLVGVRRAVHPLGGNEPSLRVFKRGAPVPLGVALSASAIAASPAFPTALQVF